MKVMKRTVLAALAIGTAALLIPGKSMSQNVVYEKQPDYVEVSGSSYKLVTPNKIEISISLKESDSKGKISLSSLENTLIGTLKGLGIDPETDLKVTDQSSNYKKRSDVYQFKDYMLTVQNASMVADVFDRLSAAGISNAEVVNATRTDIEEIQKEVKVQAIKNAQDNARVLAEAVGQTIGKAIFIQDYSSSPVLYRAAATKTMAGYADANTAEGISLDFKDIRIEQRVTARFLLE